MRFKHAVLSLAMLALAGCGGSSGGSGSVSDVCNDLTSSEFSCDTMLTDLVAEGVIPVVEDFETNLALLDTSVGDYCADISNSTKLETAGFAWVSVMVPLQQLNVMGFGPNADLENGLTSFYDWETANPINIDIAIAKSVLFAEIDLPASDNEKDLVAIEYILFAPSVIQTDGESANENSNVKTWREQNTEENEIQQDRCDYAKLITADMVNRVAALKTNWQQFDLASVSSSKQVAANEVAQALFYVDTKTKDLKIKALLPQVDQDNNDAETFNASKVESQFAHISKEHIIENLKGLRVIYTANGNMGLDDYLVAAGQDQIAADMLSTLDAAITNAEAINDSLFDAVTNAADVDTCSTIIGTGLYDVDTESSDIDTLCALQGNVKAFTDVLKFEMIPATSFTAPASADGDND